MIDPIQIMVMSGPYDGSEIRLTEPNNRHAAKGPGYIFGRRDDCDLSLPYDRWVSSRHARLFQEDGQWFLEDLKSTNKTYLGKLRADGSFDGREVIEGIVPVDYGQLIQLGRVWIRIHRL
jgi:pSer/pThr/pTyr-binding forkhead associated (FHA) protein